MNSQLNSGASDMKHNWKDSLAFFESDLFKDVQMAALFKDSKTFADAIVKTELSEVLRLYSDEVKAAASNGENIDLAAFVEQHFVIPSSDNATANTTFDSVSHYIESMWNVLTRTPDVQHKDSLIALSRPYIVPGGRFREIYYWDSYFTALGLIDAGRVNMAINMLENFVDILNEVGCIPNGNRAYYYSRSQPPILALFYQLLEAHLTPAQKQYAVEGMKKEYAFWMNQSANAPLRVIKMPCGAQLNRYFDSDATPRPESYREDIETAELIVADKAAFYQHVRAACESGWDFSSRWLENANELSSIRTTEIIPIDLNALLVTLEETLASVTQGDEANVYQSAKARRVKAINTYLYSEEKQGYFDFHYPTQQITNVVSAAMTVPLFVGIADKAQAKAVEATLSSHLLKAGGVVTTMQETSQQWDAPNGWAPLQLFAAEGLRRYGYERQAISIMRRFCTTVEDSFSQNGVLLEKYNVCEPNIKAGGGEYEVQLGFGWTNGVYTRFKTHLSGNR